MRRSQLIKKMQPILLRRRDELRRTINSELTRFNTTDERAIGDVADYAVEDDYGTINSQLAEVESRELARIEQALVRMRRGEYGICQQCNRQIPMARLQALPYAVTCVKCQQSGEENNPSNRLAEYRSRVEDKREGDESWPPINNNMAV